MNITKENIGVLNTVVKIDIVADDYQEKVTKILKDYRKKADIPGFRKGHIPMGMIKKQYGKSVMIDEVNKLLKDSLNKFLEEEKLEILGHPLPKIQKDFSWDTENFSFEFELGLTPEFDVNLKSRKKIDQYIPVVTEELLDKEVKDIQNRYPRSYSLDEATKESNVTGTFINEEKEINKTSTFSFSELKGEQNEKKLIGAKVGDVIELETKELLKDKNRDLSYILGISDAEADDLDITVTLTIEKITTVLPADLDKQLFDEAFRDGNINTVTELRERIREDFEKYLSKEADRRLLNATKDYLVENTKFDLPSAFLKKWLVTSGENKLTTEEAEERYKNSEKDLRYQLIEIKIMKDNDIKFSYEELVDFTRIVARSRMEEYGNFNPTENEVDAVTKGFLEDKETVSILEKQLLDSKMLAFYKENLSFKTKEVSYEDFIKNTIS